jgi:hypothetical protein
MGCGLVTSGASEEKGEQGDNGIVGDGDKVMSGSG